MVDGGGEIGNKVEKYDRGSFWDTKWAASVLWKYIRFKKIGFRHHW